METYARIPIIRLWNILLVPLQGEITDSLAERLTEEVLQKVYADQVGGLVIDVTGLWMVDSHLCAVLSQIAEAAALMGSRTYISGLGADIALTLETMGVEMRGVVTSPNLDEALEALGVRLAPDHAAGMSATEGAG